MNGAGASEKQQQTKKNQSLKLAIAVALLRSKLTQKESTGASTAPSESDAQRWRRKAKERKRELLRIKEDFKRLEDGSQYDLFTQNATCKCYFFENLGKSRSDERSGGCHYNSRFSAVLHRRFMRHVRLKESWKRRANSSVQLPHSSGSWDSEGLNYILVTNAGLTDEEEKEQLRAAVDFLVELCDTVSPVEEANFSNWSHQAVDFILASFKNLISREKSIEPIEGILSSLITRLIRRISAPLKGDETRHSDSDAEFYIQHIIRKLGSEPYIGQRALLSVSQRISAVAESLLFMDPFDEAFPDLHSCMFVMIQLVEFLVSDYLLAWSQDERFDNLLFEEWVTSIIHARKALELLETRCGLYMLYMDRVTGQLAKQAGQISSVRKIKLDIFDNLFH